MQPSQPSQIIDGILKAEGSAYTDNPLDSGGPTKYGITLKTLQSIRADATAETVKALTEPEARQIYLQLFYLNPKLDLLGAVSMPVAAEVMDTGVNIGTSGAVKMLQRALNLFNRQGKLYADIAVDGKIGKGTADTLAAYLKARGKDAEKVLVVTLNCFQAGYYADLSERRVKDEEFFYGWVRERVVHQII
jgi:lysozyme family protein